MKSALPFLNYVQARCEQAGIRFVLYPRGKVQGDAIGVFDDDKKVLLVCAEREDWLTTTAHEVGHMEQYLTGSGLWAACAKRDDWDRYEGWIAGTVRVTPRELLHITRRIQRLELDAERRALKLIRMFGLSSNIPLYIRDANFGVWQYEVSRLLGRWIPKKTETIARMPDRLMHVAEIATPPADFGL